MMGLQNLDTILENEKNLTYVVNLNFTGTLFFFIGQELKPEITANPPKFNARNDSLPLSH